MTCINQPPQWSSPNAALVAPIREKNSVSVCELANTSGARLLRAGLSSSQPTASGRIVSGATDASMRSWRGARMARERHQDVTKPKTELESQTDFSLIFVEVDVRVVEEDPLNDGPEEREAGGGERNKVRDRVDGRVGEGLFEDMGGKAVDCRFDERVGRRRLVCSRRRGWRCRRRKRRWGMSGWRGDLERRLLGLKRRIRRWKRRNVWRSSFGNRGKTKCQIEPPESGSRRSPLTWLTRQLGLNVIKRFREQRLCDDSEPRLNSVVSEMLLDCADEGEDELLWRVDGWVVSRVEVANSFVERPIERELPERRVAESTFPDELGRQSSKQRKVSGGAGKRP